MIAPALTRTRLILAFLAVYVCWGSTYLAIKVVVQTLPPLTLSGIRFLMAGVLMYLFLRMRGTPKPDRIHWRGAAVGGLCLILGGNGLVSIASLWIDSGLIAVLVSVTPLYMTLLGWWSGQGSRPGLWTWMGLLLGLAGVGLLVGPSFASRNLLLGSGLALLAPLIWSLGALYGRRSPQPASTMLFAAMQMTCGGAATLAVALFTGEPFRANWLAGSAQSWWALLYLLVFGSWIGFSAFITITKYTPPAVSSSYAYVNPVIAVLLGVVLLHEPLSTRTLLGMGLTLAAVVLVLFRNAKAPA